MTSSILWHVTEVGVTSCYCWFLSCAGSLFRLVGQPWCQLVSRTLLSRCSLVRLLCCHGVRWSDLNYFRYSCSMASVGQTVLFAMFDSRLSVNLLLVSLQLRVNILFRGLTKPAVNLCPDNVIIAPIISVLVFVKPRNPTPWLVFVSLYSLLTPSCNSGNYSPFWWLADHSFSPRFQTSISHRSYIFLFSCFLSFFDPYM